MIKRITATDAYAVRHPVLREGKPLDSCRFDGDDLDTTFHLGYFIDHELAGVVTLLEKPHLEIPSNHPFQLRGMAVLQKFQKKGIGYALVQKAEEIIQQKNGTQIWMNARIIAIGFYEGLGYQKFGPAFEIPIVGTHYVMTKTFHYL